MASNKVIRSGPVALTTTTTTNILNPPTLTGGTGLAGTNSATYLILRKIRVVNTTATPIYFALWLGATGTNSSGKEALAGGTATAGALDAGKGSIVMGNDVWDWQGILRIDTADYLVGGASAAGLTFEAEGEIGIV